MQLVFTVLVSRCDRLPAQVHGILVQLPLPEHISEAAVLKSIRVDKDADGFAAENAARRKGNTSLSSP